MQDKRRFPFAVSYRRNGLVKVVEDGAEAFLLLSQWERS